MSKFRRAESSNFAIVPKRRKSAGDKALLKHAEDIVKQYADYYWGILADYQLDFDQKVREINKTRGKFTLKTLLNAIIIVGNENMWASYSPNPKENKRVQKALEGLEHYTEIRDFDF